MNRLFLLLFLFVSLPLSSQAKRGRTPLDVLVRNSDLIVIGTLHAASEIRKDRIDYGQGLIIVDDVIWGDAVLGKILSVTWKNPSDGECFRSYPLKNEGERGIWFLNLNGTGEIRAEQLDPFIELENRKEIERLLIACRFSIRWPASLLIKPDMPLNFTFVFRNPVEDELDFPAIEYRDGHLYLDPRVKLELFSRDIGKEKARLDPLPDKIIVLAEPFPIPIKAKQEHQITLNLLEIFDLRAGEPYDIELTVEGFGPKAERFFMLGGAINQKKAEPAKDDSDF
jgi:hypothetical protein